MAVDRDTAARKSDATGIFPKAERMVAWELEIATGNVLYSASADTEQIRLCLEDRGFVAAVVDQALQASGPYSVESRVAKTDGSATWISIQGVAVRDSAGLPIRIIGIAQDITERREIDDRLRNIAAGVSAATGETFFRFLAQHLSLALNVDCAFIGEIQEHD